MDGRQPVDRGQAAASPRTGMEHPFLVLIERSQMRVMSWRLQLVSANTHTHTHSENSSGPGNAPRSPCPKGWNPWGRSDKPKRPSFRGCPECPLGGYRRSSSGICFSLTPWDTRLLEGNRQNVQTVTNVYCSPARCAEEGVAPPREG